MTNCQVVDAEHRIWVSLIILRPPLIWGEVGRVKDDLAGWTLEIHLSYNTSFSEFNSFNKLVRIVKYG